MKKLLSLLVVFIALAVSAIAQPVSRGAFNVEPIYGNFPLFATTNLTATIYAGTNVATGLAWLGANGIMVPTRSVLVIQYRPQAGGDSTNFVYTLAGSVNGVDWNTNAYFFTNNNFKPTILDTNLAYRYLAVWKHQSSTAATNRYLSYIFLPAP